MPLTKEENDGLRERMARISERMQATRSSLATKTPMSNAVAILRNLEVNNPLRGIPARADRDEKPQQNDDAVILVLEVIGVCEQFMAEAVPVLNGNLQESAMMLQSVLAQAGVELKAARRK